MSGLLLAGLVTPAVLLLVALIIGRVLRSADKFEEERRYVASWAVSRSAPSDRHRTPAGAGDRPRSRRLPTYSGPVIARSSGQLR